MDFPAADLNPLLYLTNKRVREASGRGFPCYMCYMIWTEVKQQHPVRTMVMPDGCEHTVAGLGVNVRDTRSIPADSESGASVSAKPGMEEKL